MIVYSNSANGARGNTNPKVLSYTCAAGVKLLVLTLCIGGGTDRTGGAPTYNSVAMTQVGSALKYATSPETVVEMWYMLNPPTGSAYDISIPNSGPVYITAEAASFSTSNASNLIEFVESGNNTGATTPYVSAAHSIKDSSLFIAVCGTGFDSGITAASVSGGTSLYAVDDGTYGDAAAYYIGTDELNKTISWARNAEDWAILSGVFLEVAATAPIVEVTKANVYAVSGPPLGVSSSKANIYAVTNAVERVSCSKANIYAVVKAIAPSSTARPMICIIT